MGKRYKFSSQGIHDVRNCFLASGAVKQQDSADFETFLKLLVFETETPHVKGLPQINQALLRTFFPFHWDDASQDKCFKRVSEKVLELFKPVESIPNTRANWATVSDRKRVFEEFISQFKKEISLGSTKAYELGALTELFNKLKFELIKKDGLKEEISSWADSPRSEDNFCLPVVNVHCKESIATLTTLQILKQIQGSPLQSKTLVVHVNNEEGIENVVNHFKQLSGALSPNTEKRRERFCFVIEVSPSFQPVEQSSEKPKAMAQQLAELEDLRKWIQFVIVTQRPIKEQNASVELKSIEDTPLKWSDLPEEAKSYLYEKILFLEGNKKTVPTSTGSSKFQDQTDTNHYWQTSLKVLGLRKDTIDSWLDPASLAQLIIHDQNEPLCLGLPKYDSDLNAIYIDRTIKFPIVWLNKMSEELKTRITYDENDYNNKISDEGKNSNTYYLLRKLQSTFSNSDFQWLKSRGEGFEELKHHVTKAKDSNWVYGESYLLTEGATFGTGSEDNKLAIVVDLAGKGKTCLLTSLTNQFLRAGLEKEKLDYLILRINLLKVQESTWKSSHTLISDENTAVNFLVDNLLTFEIKKEPRYLGQTIIKQMCLSGSSAAVFLLFDGFDEISDDQRLLIFELTKHLLAARGIVRIILTSRPDNGLEEKLEEYFKQFTLHLQNFTEQNQIDFLVKRWNVMLSEERANAVESGQGETITGYAIKLVKYSQKALKDEYRSFLDIPLQCMIVSECFFNDLKSYLEKHQNDTSSLNKIISFQDENFDLLCLYDRFYETKIDILFKEKAKINLMEQNEAASFIKNHVKRGSSEAMQRLSLFHMMTKIEDAQVLCRFSWKSYKKFKYGEDLEQARRLGLIQGLDDSQSTIEHLEGPHVKFLHRTFAEYFFATFLIDNFTRTESQLLDDCDLPQLEILNATCKVIIEKILVDTEYEGIRRFFDRMLMDYVPRDGEPCPFATKNRADVFKEWPVISHEKFNSFLAQTLMSHCSDMFKQWHEDEDNKFESNCLLEQNIGTLRNLDTNPTGALSDLLIGEDNNMPCVSFLLINCMKEYAARLDVSDDQREGLAHSLTCASLMWVMAEFYESDTRKRITTSLMHWFDPVVGLSVEKNLVFSRWFFKIVNYLIDRANTPNGFAALGLACSMMNNHRQVPHFQNQVKQIAKCIFDVKRDTLANRYFEIEIYYDPTWDQAKARCFRGVLSLSSLVFPDTSLLQLQVDWFLDKLAKTDETRTVASFNKHIREIQSFPITSDEHDVKCLLSECNFPNPVVFIETLEFFLSTNQLDQISIKNAVDTKATMLYSAIHSYFSQLSCLMKIFYKLNLVCVSLTEEQIILLKSECHEFCNTAAFCLLGHFLMSDRVIGHLSDDHQPKREEYLNLFSGLTRRALIFVAAANCSSFVQNRNRPGRDIYFHFEIYYFFAGKTKQFENWFKDKLKTLWDEKGELQFIDFLFQNETKLPDDCPEQDEYELKALPCLLISDMVTPYIPYKLSSVGLKHFEETLENVPFPRMEESHREEHFRTLKQKIQERKTGVRVQSSPCNLM